jgi:spore coat polysaccharide biosynthesis protein SpsF
MTVAIIQARFNSSRLRGKILLNLGGMTVLARIIHRTRLAPRVHQVVVATSTRSDDDATEAEARACGVRVSRGPEQDVLERFRAAAAEAINAQTVIRITADCPLVDPALLNAMLHRWETAREEGVHYLANVINRRYPRGLDLEIFSREGLEIAAREATLEPEREHVTEFFTNHPERFRLENFTWAPDHSQYRWTLDTDLDWQFFCQLFEAIGPSSAHPEIPTTEQALQIMADRPDIASLNATVKQKS